MPRIESDQVGNRNHEAFKSCEEITWHDGKGIRRAKVARRIDPVHATGMEKLITVDGDRVKWIDVLSYVLPRGSRRTHR